MDHESHHSPTYPNNAPSNFPPMITPPNIPYKRDRDRERKASVSVDERSMTGDTGSGKKKRISLSCAQCTSRPSLRDEVGLLIRLGRREAETEGALAPGLGVHGPHWQRDDEVSSAVQQGISVSTL